MVMVIGLRDLFYFIFFGGWQNSFCVLKDFFSTPKSMLTKLNFAQLAKIIFNLNIDVFSKLYILNNNKKIRRFKKIFNEINLNNLHFFLNQKFFFKVQYLNWNILSTLFCYDLCRSKRISEYNNNKKVTIKKITNTKANPSKTSQTLKNFWLRNTCLSKKIIYKEALFYNLILLFLIFKNQNLMQ